MNLFRTVFGNRADEYEEQGDDLKLHAFWREAAYFYGRALEAAPEKDQRFRGRLGAKMAEARRMTFRALLDDSDSHVEAGRIPDAVTALRDAAAFASEVDEKEIVAGRLASLEGGGREPAPERAAETAMAAPADGAENPAPGGRVETLEREVEKRPESAGAHERLAAALEKEGRFAEAIRHYEAAYRRNRERVSLILEIARVLKEAMNDAVAARERLEEGCRRHRATRATFLLHLERAFQLHEEGRAEEAIACLGELLTVPDLDRGLILFNRSGLLEKAGRIEEAEADLRTAIEAAPANLLYLERLADLIFRTGGDLGRALEYLDRALAADAHDFAARRGSGTSRDRARLQFKAARILFLLERPDAARARVDEGLVVCWDSRVEEALLELRRELGDPA